MAGRPKATIDYTKLSELCQIQCNDEEIAAVLGIASKTVQRLRKRDKVFREAEVAAKKRGIVALRSAQFKYALKGDRSLLIFLGKNLLGQRDKPEEFASNNNGPTTYRWVEPEPEGKKAPNVKAIPVDVDDSDESKSVLM